MRNVLAYRRELLSDMSKSGALNKRRYQASLLHQARAGVRPLPLPTRDMVAANLSLESINNGTCYLLRIVLNILGGLVGIGIYEAIPRRVHIPQGSIKTVAQSRECGRTRVDP